LAVDLMTELGVDRIVPWQAARSIGRWRGEQTPVAAPRPANKSVFARLKEAFGA